MRGYTDVKDFLYGVQKRKDTDDGKLLGPGGDRKNVLDLRILVCVDVSGSISPQQYGQFMAQVNRIKGLSVIKVMETDTDVEALYDFEKTRGAKIARLKGGGGTDFQKAFEWAMKIKPDAVLFMTDGFVCENPKVPNPGVPVGWVLTHNGRVPYKFGKEVKRLPR